MAAMKWVLLPLILHALNVQCAGMYITLIVVQLWKMMYPLAKLLCCSLGIKVAMCMY